MKEAQLQLLRKVGNLEQLFSVRHVEYLDGKENLVRAFEVNTGGGLEFSVLENKCLDLYSLRFRGINCGFISKAGLSSAYLADQRGLSYRATQGCGMLYTAGLANVGIACADESGEQYYHGCIKNSATKHTAVTCDWVDRDYVMRISGQIPESAFWGRNLVLKRTIQAIGGSSRLTIDDVIENQNFTPDQLMLLYHFNIGYPLLDEGAVVYAPIVHTTPLSPYAAREIGSYSTMGAPIDGDDETVYLHQVRRDDRGFSAAALWNPKLQLGIYIRFRGEALKYLVQWKTRRSGDYAMGLLPASFSPVGREQAAKERGLFPLAPFASTGIQLEIGILEDESARDAFLQEWSL